MKQKNIDSDNVCKRIEDVILNHGSAVSFRGLVRKPLNDKYKFLNENFRDNIFADTFQILQHAITGKLIEVDVEYYKRYHKDNIHTKWSSNQNDYINIYYEYYRISKEFFSNKDYLLDLCLNKKLIYLDSKIKLYNMVKKTFDTIVMGGGIQGCCTALFLKKKGYDVTIIDKNSELMKGASNAHEGKIHLGFVYSNDKTLNTAEKMMIDALNFSYSIEYLLDEKH